MYKVFYLLFHGVGKFVFGLRNNLKLFKNTLLKRIFGLVEMR
jgi:hypothetical protein